MEKKKLAPLNEGGPAQLLNLQIQRLDLENTELRTRLRTVSYIAFRAQNQAQNRQSVSKLSELDHQAQNIRMLDNTCTLTP